MAGKSPELSDLFDQEELKRHFIVTRGNRVFQFVGCLYHKHPKLASQEKQKNKNNITST